MRRGCISVGQVKCDICARAIPYPERYLVVDEDEKGQEVNSGGKSIRYCIEDALEKGYAHYREVKGDMVLTFLPEVEFFETPPAEPEAPSE